jgi:hypothetical protein
VGRDFYDQIFASAIQRVYVVDRSYRDIRDTIRRE